MNIAGRGWIRTIERSASLRISCDDFRSKSVNLRSPNLSTNGSVPSVPGDRVFVQNRSATVARLQRVVRGLRSLGGPAADAWSITDPCRSLQCSGRPERFLSCSSLVAFAAPLSRHTSLIPAGIYLMNLLHRAPSADPHASFCRVGAAASYGGSHPISPHFITYGFNLPLRFQRGHCQRFPAVEIVAKRHRARQAQSQQAKSMATDTDLAERQTTVAHRSLCR